MENLGGLLFLIIMGAAALIGKIMQARKEQQGTSDEEPVDLPEIARRMLEGAGGVRRAKPRSVLPDDTEDGWTPVMPPAPAPEPQKYVPATPRLAPRPIMPPMQRQQAPPQQARETSMREMPRQAMRPQEPQRVQPPPQRQRQRPVATPRQAPSDYSDEERPRVRPDQVKRAASPQMQKSIGTSILGTSRITKPPTPVTLEQVMQKKLGIPPAKKPVVLPHHPLLHELDDIRKGIIFSEILGPPVSMR
jgi:hypothetical protein